ncbi:MAG: AzlD domain-containing protein [Gammaproteobacteria bacterium]|jgi:branched-subunit amino acid transport protein AzlD|nr:AzlD domain-containing protein [Gammaproteobacteria bacterium]
MESTYHLILIMLVMAVATFLTRALPFVVFYKTSEHPILNYLGRVLPPVIMVLLVVYSFKNKDIMSIGFLPELLALLMVALLHFIWRQPLVSIIGGTGLYMVFVQTGMLAEFTL